MVRERYDIPDFLVDLLNRCMLGSFTFEEIYSEFKKSLTINLKELSTEFPIQCKSI